MRLLWFVSLLVATPASADIPSLESQEPDEPWRERVVEPVAEESAPRPGAESGRADRTTPRDGVARIIGRGLLWFPKTALQLAAAPLRGAFYLHGRRGDRVETSAGPEKFSYTPNALVQSNAGLHVGVQARLDDLLGRDERFSLRAGLGGEIHRLAELSTELDKRVVSGGITAGFEQRYRERFFGYGNTDDPRTTYHHERLQLAPHLTVRPLEQFAVTARVALIHDETSAEQALDVAGFGEREAVASELALSWDTRRAAHAYDAVAMYGGGGAIAVFVGRSDGAVDFYRAGVDARRYLTLARGPRAIELRGHVEWVSGSRDEIPFVDLPRLGGRELLRGYDRDRFRDKVAAVAQVSYVFALSRFLAASIFTDVGRVHAGLDELSYRDQRVGFGGALELYNRKAMMIRGELASSIDGGLFMSLAFDPR